MINDTAKGERAAPEHGAIAPFFAKTQIDSAVVKFFVTECRARRKYGRVHEHGCRTQIGSSA